MGALLPQQQASSVPGWFPPSPSPDYGPGNILPDKQLNPLVPEGTLNQGEAITQTASKVGESIQREREKSAAAGLWDEVAGLPTAAGVRDTAQEYGAALIAGTTGPKAGSPLRLIPTFAERFSSPTKQLVEGDNAPMPVAASSTVANMLRQEKYENAVGVSKDMLPVIRDKIIKKAGDTPVHLVEPEHYQEAHNGMTAGFYDPNPHQIVLRADMARQPEWGPQIGLHEGVHAASAREVEQTPELKSAIDKIRVDALQPHVARGGDASDAYGFTDAHEFLAEAMSNPEFQTYLKSAPLSPDVAKSLGLKARGQQNAWTGVVDTVRKSLGLSPKSHNTLAGVMAIGDRLLPTGEATLSKAFQGAETKEAREQVAGFARAAGGGTAVGAAIGMVGGTQGDSATQPPEVRNAPYVKEDGDHEYNTSLRQADETRFRKWVSDNKVPFDPDAKVSDYDMRGFWKALKAKDPKAVSAIDPNDRRLHYPDYWKTPRHETFSNESQWAKPSAPHWNDQDQLVDKEGKVIFDDRVPKSRR